jgi:tetratricopeptide (TPR) repeat protein
VRQSRLLAELDRRMRASPDDVAWARDMCRAASQLGRQGHAELSLEAINHVRRHYGSRLHAEVACWLMLAEGVLHYFHLQYDHARDRTSRAHALAVALHVAPAQPSCAAWLAAMDFNDDRLEPMVDRLEEALSLAAPDDHQALARATLVMADALHHCGRYSEARPWYDRSRHHAAIEGDQAALSALMHNMAAFRAAQIRLADAFDPGCAPRDLHLASIEADSVQRYDLAVGTRSFHMLIPLLRAQLLTVEQRFDDALQQFDAIEGAAVPTKLSASAEADRAWCLASLGRVAEARFSARRTLALMPQTPEADEQAHVLARLSSVEHTIGETFLPDTGARARHALARHRRAQRALHQRLSELRTRLTHRMAVPIATSIEGSPQRTA